MKRAAAWCIVYGGKTAARVIVHRTMYGGNFRVRWDMYGGQNRLGSIHRTPTGRPPDTAAQCTAVSRVVITPGSTNRTDRIDFLIVV